MEMKIDKYAVVEKTAAVAMYSDFDTSGDLEITWDMIKKDPIGTEYRAEVNSNCGRDIRDIWYTLIYRDDNGAAMVQHLDRTSDDPNPVNLARVDMLKWYQFI